MSTPTPVIAAYLGDLSEPESYALLSLEIDSIVDFNKSSRVYP